MGGLRAKASEVVPKTILTVKGEPIKITFVARDGLVPHQTLVLIEGSCKAMVAPGREVVDPGITVGCELVPQKYI